MLAFPLEIGLQLGRSSIASFTQCMCDLAQAAAPSIRGPCPSARPIAQRRACVSLTVDVEEWFHAHALKVSPSSWSEFPSRLDAPIEWILERLEKHHARSTFFVLGWVANARPEIVRRLAKAGHEIASHGYHHHRADEMTIDAFREDAAAAKQLLEDLSGRPVLGYRAPSYSLTTASPAHFDALAEIGYHYDSSVYPARAWHGGYGDPSAPLHPHFIYRQLYEFPLPTLHVGQVRIPAASGAYLRMMPYRVTRFAIRQNLCKNTPVVINVHPWELDPDQPRVSAPLTARWRHYGGLRSLSRKLEWLLAEFGSVPLERLTPRASHVEMHTSSPCGNDFQPAVDVLETIPTHFQRAPNPDRVSTATP